MPEQRSSLFVSNPIRLAATGGGGGGFTGPGDVVPGAVSWWGLRAYSSAVIGANAVRLRESGGNTEQDFATISGGGLNLSAISTFKGANSLFVVKLYDQVTTNDLVQATAGVQPAFILSGIGALPVIQFISASSTLLTSGTVTQAQPYTVSMVYNNNGDTGAQACLWAGGGNNEIGVHRAVANDIFIYAGGAVPTATANANTWHAVQGVFNNATSDLYVDGSTNPSDLTSSTGIPGAGIALAQIGGGDKYNGYMGEVGYWASALSSGNKSSLNSNQHTYWGF